MPKSEPPKAYDYHTDSETGQIVAADFDSACQEFRKMFTEFALADGAWGWISDEDGYRCEVGVVP